MRGQATTLNPFSDQLQLLRSFFEDDISLDFGGTPASPASTVSSNGTDLIVTPGAKMEVADAELTVSGTKTFSGETWANFVQDSVTVADNNETVGIIKYASSVADTIPRGVVIEGHSQSGTSGGVGLFGRINSATDNISNSAIALFDARLAPAAGTDWNTGTGDFVVNRALFGVTNRGSKRMTVFPDGTMNTSRDGSVSIHRLENTVGAQTAFNEQGDDIDTRIESVNFDNAFIINAGTDTLNLNVPVKWFDDSDATLEFIGQDADTATADLTIKGQDAFASATGANIIGGDVLLEGGTGTGATSENDGRVYVNGFQFQVDRTLDWGNIASSSDTDDYGSLMSFVASGSDATRRIGIQVNMTGTYSGAEFTQTLGFLNNNPGSSATYNSDTSLFGYRPAGDRGIFGGSIDSSSAGIKSGGVFLAGGANTENYGVWGASTITRTSGQNVGVLGAAINAAGTEFGVAAFLGTQASQPITRASSAALLADNSTADEDIFVAMHNGVDKVLIDEIGNMGIGGQTSPTAYLHAAAGTATAGTAPIKLTDGTLLTTPEAGAIEYNDGHFYFTNPGSRLAAVMSNGVITANTAVTNTTTETEIYTRTSPANELHEDEVYRLHMLAAYSNAAASDDFTIRVKLNGVTIHTVNRLGGNVTDVGFEVLLTTTIRTDGASGTYISSINATDDTDSYTRSTTSTAAIDTTTTNTFSMTVQWDNAKAGNVFTATQGYIELIH